MVSRTSTACCGPNNRGVARYLLPKGAILLVSDGDTGHHQHVQVRGG